MIEKKLFRTFGRGCAIQSALQITLLLIFLAVCVSLMVMVFLLPTDDDMKLYIVLGGFMVFMFLMITGVAIWAVWTIRNRANKLDESFSPLGLMGKMYLTNGRQFHGTVRGRQVDVYFYRGPTLDIYVAAPLRTRLSVTLKSWVGKLAGDLLERKPLELRDPDTSHLAIYALDERWGRDLLEDHRALEIVLQLTSDESPYEIRQLLVQPNALQLRLQHTRVANITPENARDWMDALLELAGIAEGLMPARVTAEETKLERTSRRDRNAYILPIAGITCGLVAALSVFVLVVSAVLIYLTEGGF
jgi:hypothetical protein